MNIHDPVRFRINVTNEFDKIINDKQISLNLEKGIFNYSINEAKNKKIVKKWENSQFVQIYCDHFRTIYFNITEEPTLLDKLQNKIIKPHILAFMTHQELNPERWKDLIDRKIKREKHKYADNIASSTDTFTCRKCKKNKCTYYQMQTRSADEPMTTFVTCLNCGTRWKC